jgi:DNA-directed RNA polymerase beta' subunit/intein/homing endonuclease
MSRKQDTQPSRIIGIQFSMASPDEIRRNSVVHIESRDTFIGNKPCMGGLFDSRMGVLESGLICPTDGLTYIDTPGYFGHIELARPVFFIQHIKEIMKIARCICFKCSKLLLNKNQHKHILELSSEERWEYVAPLAAKIKRCGDSTDNGCGCKQPDSVKLEGMGTIHAIWENIERQRQVIKITPEHMLKIFRRISDDDISFMGFSPAWSRPEWMICQVLPVPPPAVRPSVKHDAQQRSEDDLTHIYSNIIKTNRDLNDKIQNNANPMVIDQLTSVLQYLIAMIVNNKVKGAVPMAQRNGRPLQCIRDRLDSKSGRVRGNLMGKRVDFSARSVITGDPNLSLKQLGVPLKIAKNITKPVTVNARNMNFLMMLIQNGPEVHPGAKMLERKNGEMFSLRNVDRASIKLEHGDIVHRHMMDGDAVLFNRQPSLHRMSMMCHIVKIMKQGDTFRMNVCCTKPYNADFDGDEMNMHMPQNVLAETELRHLAATPLQMISPSGNSPIIGIYQDSLLGSYRFTRPNLKVSPRDAMNLLMMYPKVDVSKLREAIKDDAVSTFDVLSQIVSPITLKYKTKLFEQEEIPNNVLEIRNGKYIRGQIEKGVLGASTKGIIHRICNDFGNMAAASFIDDIQNIVTEYMKSSSFSVGISDLIANKKTQESILQIIHEKKHEVQSVIDKVHLGIFENNTSSTNMKEFETKVNNLLNKATDLSGKEGRKSLSKQNRFLMIVNSGSKGSLVNISQMISCLGQQNVDGQRIPYGYDNRTLPHFCKFDDSPTARGFIENSYISGLTAPELFFHAMGGRIGLIDTACKSVTWETPIIIIENNEPKYIEIGKWIDQRLEANKASVKHYTERQMELLDLDDPIYIPTTDENGIITWGEVTAMTRHDPGNQLYEIVTSGGRKVIVTESKSLLIWDSKTSTLKETSTPDITVGNFVPVNGELCQPPVMIESIDMTKYFPKSEYGTEFPEQFPLNEENGIFIGLFLAEGNCWKSSVKITNNNENIRTFVKNWFEKHSIKFVETQRVNKIGGLTTTINGNSGILSKLLTALCGHGAANKHIPTEAFIASDEFIVGLLNGYYSGDGNVTKNSVDVGSVSYRLIEGVSMLCTRLGIYGSIKKRQLKKNNLNTQNIKPTYTLRISANWGQTFAEKITLLEEKRNERLKQMKWRKTHMNYKSYNNIVLDKIVEINLVDVKDHPKVYDLTIPSTLNFGLSNGLQVRDTSSTGYIQRRLIKGLEDAVVGYDLTVRNNKGRIIQFAYGDDGFDSTKVENQTIPLTGMTIEDVYMLYDIIGVNDEKSELLGVYEKGTITRLRKQRNETVAKCKSYIERMLEARRELVEKVFHFKDDTSVKVPVAFQYMIANIQGQLNLNANSTVDITPLEAFELIEKQYSILEGLHYAKPTALFRILYDYYLSPKDLLINKRFHRKALIYLLENIVLKYKQAIVNPGEMVGVIAGQSIGEPTTQLTLNTFHLAGVASKSNVTRGVPRIEEILRLTKNPKNPSLTIVLKPIDETDQDKAMNYGKMLEHTKLIDVVKSVQIYFDPIEDATVIEEDKQLIEQFYEFEKFMTECMDENDEEEQQPRISILGGGSKPFEHTDRQASTKSKWIIRLEINEEKLLDKNITMDDIHFAITNGYPGDIKCAYSDYNAGNLVLRIRMNSDIFKKKSSGADSLDQSDKIFYLKSFQDTLLNNVVLRGVSGIQNVLPRKLQNTVVLEDGKYMKKDTWVLDTTGSNLLEILGNHLIDGNRTFCNDIKEVYDVLGIEAARQVIYNEFVDVMEFSDVYINYHHLSLLCDRMTMTKNMVPIFRSGILKDDIGPIAKATFEMHTEGFLNAARHGEFDSMCGVSANVMCGQYGKYGTNAFNVLLDMKEMVKLKVDDIVIKDSLKEIEKQFGFTEESSGCSQNEIIIRNNISAIHAEPASSVCDDNYEFGI